MARELYTLLTGQHNLFCVPVDPGAVAIYTHPVVTGQQVDLLPLLGAALENFPARKRKKKFWFHVH